jgi:hypothetical protein
MVGEESAAISLYIPSLLPFCSHTKLGASSVFLWNYLKTSPGSINPKSGEDVLINGKSMAWKNQRSTDEKKPFTLT